MAEDGQDKFFSKDEIQDNPYGFTASKDYLDSIRLEASTLSPAEAANLEAEAATINYLLQTNFGEFIPKGKLEKNKNLQDRVLALTPEANGVFMTDPYEDPKEWMEDIPGVYINEGEFSVINSERMDMWEKHFPEGARKHLIEITGSEEAARKLAEEELKVNVLAHEMTHHYQIQILPTQEDVEFMEGATRYYHKAIAKQLGKGTINEGWEKPEDTKFKIVLNQFGDDVHRVYFGTPVDPTRRDLIFSAFKSIELPRAENTP